MKTCLRKLLKAIFVLQTQIFFVLIERVTSKENIYLETGLPDQSFPTITRSKFNFILLFAGITCILHVICISLRSHLLLFVSIACN